MIVTNLKAMPAPKLADFKAALTEHTGTAPIPSNGVSAIAQRGRFFRVKYVHSGLMDTGRPKSVHYYMPQEGDFTNDNEMRFLVAPRKLIVLSDHWHFLFTERMRACKKHLREATYTTATFEEGRSIRPYEYVTLDVDNPDGYRLLTYGAYNAMGLIGSESNGIAVLCNREKEVVADEINNVSSGWGGPTIDTRFLFRVLARLMMEDREGFAVMVNKHFGVSRLRTQVKV